MVDVPVVSCSSRFRTSGQHFFLLAVRRVGLAFTVGCV